MKWKRHFRKPFNWLGVFPVQQQHWNLYTKYHLTNWIIRICYLFPSFNDKVIIVSLGKENYAVITYRYTLTVLPNFPSARVNHLTLESYPIRSLWNRKEFMLFFTDFSVVKHCTHEQRKTIIVLCFISNPGFACHTNCKGLVITILKCFLLDIVIPVTMAIFRQRNMLVPEVCTSRLSILQLPWSLFDNGEEVASDWLAMFQRQPATNETGNKFCIVYSFSWLNELPALIVKAAAKMTISKMNSVKMTGWNPFLPETWNFVKKTVWCFHLPTRILK